MLFYDVIVSLFSLNHSGFLNNFIIKNLRIINNTNKTQSLHISMHFETVQMGILTVELLTGCHTSPLNVYAFTHGQELKENLWQIENYKELTCYPLSRLMCITCTQSFLIPKYLGDIFVLSSPCSTVLVCNGLHTYWLGSEYKGNMGARSS